MQRNGPSRFMNPMVLQRLWRANRNPKGVICRGIMNFKTKSVTSGYLDQSWINKRMFENNKQSKKKKKKKNVWKKSLSAAILHLGLELADRFPVSSNSLKRYGGPVVFLPRRGSVSNSQKIPCEKEKHKNSMWGRARKNFKSVSAVASVQPDCVRLVKQRGSVSLQTMLIMNSSPPLKRPEPGVEPDATAAL